MFNLYKTTNVTVCNNALMQCVLTVQTCGMIDDNEL